MEDHIKLCACAYEFPHGAKLVSCGLIIVVQKVHKTTTTE